MGHEEVIVLAATAIADADALVISAGAGMGVDSGLPDFRGDKGFWRAYPPFARLGLNFYDLADPRWFATDPALAWGFYGHRMMLYRSTLPHEGFGLLRSWAGGKPHGCFVFTSNVDGQFQRAGFDPARVVECHGAIDWLQCTKPCGAGIFSAEGISMDVDPDTFRVQGELPECPSCGALARPNILMFGDWDWDDTRAAVQHERWRHWFQQVRRAGARVAIVECGAGTSVPSVRYFSEHSAATLKGTLIRINTREAQVPAGHLSLSLSALAALRSIDQHLGAGGRPG